MNVKKVKKKKKKQWILWLSWIFTWRLIWGIIIIKKKKQWLAYKQVNLKIYKSTYKNYLFYDNFITSSLWCIYGE